MTADNVAELNARALLKRLESGTGLRGSTCVLATTILRPPQMPLGLAFLGRMTLDHDEPTETAACITFLNPGTAATVQLRDLAIGKHPEDASERRGQLASLDTFWAQSEVLDPVANPTTAQGVRKLLVGDAAALVGNLPLFSFSAVGTIDAWAKRADAFGLATSFSLPYWTRWLTTRMPGFISAAAAWLLALVAIVLMSHSSDARAFLLFHPLGRQLAVFGQVNALIFAIPRLRQIFFQPYRSAMLGILTQQDAHEYNDQAYFSGSGAAQLQRVGIAAQLRELDRRTASGDATPPGSVVAALKTWRGRVVLVGPSGRGKTMFLRHHIPARMASASRLSSRPRRRWEPIPTKPSLPALVARSPTLAFSIPS
jgi:hypothetical protein